MLHSDGALHTLDQLYHSNVQKQMLQEPPIPDTTFSFDELFKM